MPSSLNLPERRAVHPISRWRACRPTLKTVQPPLDIVQAVLNWARMPLDLLERLLKVAEVEAEHRQEPHKGGERRLLSATFPLGNRPAIRPAEIFDVDL